MINLPNSVNNANEKHDSAWYHLVAVIGTTNQRTD